MKNLFIHINKCGGTSVKRVLANYDHTYIPPNDNLINISKTPKWSKYYKFTIVRNPYTRILSLYGMLIKNNKGKKLDDVLDIITDDNIKYKGGVKGKSYVKRHGLKMTHPHYSVYGDKGLMVDDFYKLEDIETGWDEIKSKLGINDELPKINVSKSYSKSDVKMFNRKQLDIINNYFLKDFEVFKYPML